MKTIQEINEALKESDSKGYDIWSNPKRRPADTTKGDECEYCLRKCGKNPLHVHITTDGTIVPNDITEEDLERAGHESQGCFPIGTGCAKSLFAAEDIEKYTFRYKDK